jgi:hypothetical protein
MLGVALALVLSMCGNEALVLVQTPSDQARSPAKKHRISVELKVPTTWKGHSILIQAWPFAPGTLDQCFTDTGVTEPERHTLVNAHKLVSAVTPSEARG